MASAIRILLVDDHSLFRESLSRLLQSEPDLRIVGSCTSIAEALEILAREPADIVLLDYDLGNEQGSAFLDRAKERGFEGRVLMVTAGMGETNTLRALEAGSAGVFLKHSPPADLVNAIHRIFAGEMWLDPRAVRSVVAAARGRAEEQRNLQPLNARERTVLKAVFEGFTNKEIALQLQTSEGSVKAVMQQLFDKTGVRTRSQLVRIALERHAQDWLTTE
ncbi:MAG: response regulator transcription factor [Bryobacteraceae bacterium]|jgi:DNA-binding NarL/FixJ family response regulator